MKLLKEQLNGFLESAKKLEIEGLFGLEQDNTHSEEQKNNDPLEEYQQEPDHPQTPSSPEDEQFNEPEDDKHEVKTECNIPTKRRRQNSRGPLNVTAVFNASSLTTEEVEMKRKELYQKDDSVWICLVCDYDTKDGSNIKKHVEKHIEGLSYPCTLCSKEFKSRVTFYRHMHKGHN